MRCALAVAYADTLGDAAMGAQVRMAGDADANEDAEGGVAGDTIRDAAADVVMDAMAHAEEDKSVSATEDAEEGASCNTLLTAE